jgi:hypothetical protein
MMRRSVGFDKRNPAAIFFFCLILLVDCEPLFREGRICDPDIAGKYAQYTIIGGCVHNGGFTTDRSVLKRGAKELLHHVKKVEA